ncbi:MAG: type II toxin-antitoxin system HipA family toxin [Bdellovibrionaceae bacterium]|nr:type II toxin-antitoxin system HipA family toxin [Pseudobdellovibrionaceae bacterium]
MPVRVYLWGKLIGAASYPPAGSRVAAFEFTPEFISSGIEIAPLKMKLAPTLYQFPEISERTFKGLPGMLSDSLPDKFGNQLIDKHLASKGFSPQDITAIDRLLYVGNRAMGALEYEPAQGLTHEGENRGGILDLAALTELANRTLSKNDELQKKIENAETQQAAFDLLRVGTSAGGARAKALIALDPNGLPKVGHLDHGVNHTYWLMKFDGIEANRDRDGTDPQGVTVLEYIYSLIAKKCEIQMPACRLLEEGDHRHFLIERFDRIIRNEKVDKLHYTSWCGMAHAHRDLTNAFSYEQLVLVMRELNLPQAQITELFRRAVFNVVGRNQDDHTKNFGFLMNRDGEWNLSPAFDMMYSYDPTGKWTRTHQISLNGKADQFTRNDLIAFGKHCSLSGREVSPIIDRTIDAFSTFPTLAKTWKLPRDLTRTVASQLRLKL